jgi:hypothetical protein
VFGGPVTEKITGVEFGPRPLQLVARLELSWMTQHGPEPLPVLTLPLLYGFPFDGCELTYLRTPTGRIEILELDPATSSDDFPYSNYPVWLPYVPLRVARVERSTYKGFAADYPNMAADQPSEVVVAVPPPATLGVSLWGPMGDLEGVTVVFECGIAERTVRAYNRRH